MPTEFVRHSFEMSSEKIPNLCSVDLIFGYSKIVFGDKFYNQVK